MWLAELPRVFELAAYRKAPKSYLRNFSASLRDNALKRQHFMEIEAELATLDASAWDHVKVTVGPLFIRNETTRDWRGAASVLNEARAYNFLVRRGYTSVAFIPRAFAGKTPDLRAKSGSVDVLCEVKTINRFGRAREDRLRAEFFTKLASTIRDAERQMADYSPESEIKRIIYLVIDFDAALYMHIDAYLAQIEERREEFVAPELEIVFDTKRRKHISYRSSKRQ